MAAPLLDQFSRPLPAIAQRSFEGAKQTRLNADWWTAQTSLDYDIRWQGRLLIDRARWLEQSTDIGEGYLKLLERNVVGSKPFQLQMKIYEPDGVTHDRMAEVMIERAWRKQCKKRNWTVRKMQSFADTMRVCIRGIARDGGVLIRKYRGRNFGPYGFAVDVMDIDFLDLEFNRDFGDAGKIRMGVEFDAMGAPIAYHLLGSHPGDYYVDAKGAKRTRVPARDIIHPFIFKRANQTRGYTEFASIMGNVRQLEGYKEAEVVAARVAASKMGFFEKATGENVGYGGEGRDSGGKYMDAEPGALEELPAGMKFVQYDPQHPTAAFGDFIKDNKRGDAAALGVSYMSFAQDPGDANFSSARIGLLDEREYFKILQDLMVEHICEDIFEDWLFTALSFQTIGTLPVSKFDKFNSATFTPHRWDWLDPRSDTDARAIAEDRGWISAAQIIAERGGDEEETSAEVAATVDERIRLGFIKGERLKSIQEGRAFLAAQEDSEETPLAAKLGVGGTQSLTQFLQQISLPTNAMSDEAILTTLTAIFGMKLEDAKKVAKRKPQPAPAPVSTE